ncbi:MAG: sugar ABC transporter permease [Erysipelotrichaceae bacterium]|nr:sugar ABC transporter permease [Erysipelotrichaceae bacterium]
MEKIKQNLLSFWRSFSTIFTNYVTHFKMGDTATRMSYVVMGAGSLLRKQYGKGILYLLVQIAFTVFMITNGIYYLSMLPTLGINEQGRVWDEVDQIYRVVKGDNSMLLLLFGMAVVIVCVVFIGIYLMNTDSAYKNQKLLESGKKLPSFKDDLKTYLDERFHVTVLSLPVLSLTLFTIIPIIFMIAMAFTNYDKNHQPPGNLFTWVGLDNFTNVLWKNPLWSKTFVSLFIWTIIWAFFATFLNYILGMILAMIINKKGIKLKGMWRTIFVITIAVPQFVSLMLMSKLLADTGAINNVLQLFGRQPIHFLTNGTIAKIVVIVINLWVGIPYTMLITSGILMNIPQDLYESATIDGAGPVTQFFKITLPYMLHVTTPYLITQFIGNINNFNVIYLLTAGDPKSLNYYQAGETDLLITWLFKLTTVEQNYAVASVIGIIIFIICAVVSLITFNKSSAMTKEDEFQ